MEACYWLRIMTIMARGLTPTTPYLLNTLQPTVYDLSEYLRGASNPADCSSELPVAPSLYYCYSPSWMDCMLIDSLFFSSCSQGDHTPPWRHVQWPSKAKARQRFFLDMQVLDVYLALVRSAVSYPMPRWLASWHLGLPRVSFLSRVQTLERALVP